MEINHDLELNGDGLSVHFSWIALPPLQYLFGFVIQTIAETSFHLVDVDGSVFLNDRVQHDGPLDMRLTCIIGVVRFGLHWACRSRCATISADFIDASAKAASTSRAGSSSIPCTYAMT